MNHRILTIALGLAAATIQPLHAQSGAYDGPPERLHIYLLIGQSNMAGRAPMFDEHKAPVPRAFLWNRENQWEPATSPLNRHATIRKELDMQKLGPGHAFAATMTQVVPGISVGIIVNARGGSSIREWVKGGRFYNESLALAAAARETGQLRGILWHQGESDDRDGDYLEKLTTLIADFRADLDAPELPFVAGQIHNVPLINEQIAKLPETVPFTAFASSEGLVAYDCWHFDTPSTILLGQRYAEAMIELQKNAANRPR